MTRKSLQRTKQIAKPDSFDDQKSAVEISASEVDSINFEDFLEHVLSQLKRIIHGDSSGNWYDNPETVFGGDATLRGLFFASGGGGGLDPDKILTDENYEVLVDEDFNVLVSE